MNIDCRNTVPLISQRSRSDRYITIAIWLLLVFFLVSGLLAMWYTSPRVPYADYWRLITHFLVTKFPQDVITADNGHLGVFPNMIRVAELRLFGGGQLLQIVIGMALVLATMAQIWRTIFMDKATVLPASLLFAVIGLFWLGNVRALGNGNESVHAYLVTFCLVSGIRILSQLEVSRSNAMRHAVIAAVIGIVATFSFGSGIACFAAFTLVLAIRRSHWQQWLVVVSGMMVALVANVIIGDVHGSISLAPITQTTHLLRWLAGPFVYVFWPFLDPLISAQIPFAAIRVPSQFIARMTEGLFGPVMLALWPHLLIGLVGLAWLAITTWRTWYRPSPTALLSSAMSWFALMVGVLIALARIEHLRVYPEQLLAPRYVVWSSIFWAGLGMSTVVQSRRPALAKVFALLVGFTLLPSQVWMGKLGDSIRHVAENTALAATVGVIEPNLLLGESQLTDITTALPRLRDARAEMFSWPETHYLGQKLSPVDVEVLSAIKLNVVHVSNKIGEPGRRLYFDFSAKPVQRLLLADNDGIIRGLAIRESWLGAHWTGWMQGQGDVSAPLVAVIRHH